MEYTVTTDVKRVNDTIILNVIGRYLHGSSQNWQYTQTNKHAYYNAIGYILHQTAKISAYSEHMYSDLGYGIGLLMEL